MKAKEIKTMNRRRASTASRKKWIQWFLDFVQSDLSSLPKARRDELVQQGSQFLSLHTEGDRVFVNTALQNLFKRVHEATLPAKLDALQTALKGVVKWMTEPRGQYGLPQVEYSLTNLDGHFYKIAPHDLTLEQYWEQLAVHIFSDLIHGVELCSIKRCKGCGRYFVELTKRGKLYCNNSCASRSIQREKMGELKKDPEKYDAYLERQRNYLRKRYRKRC
jgi:hypothetical protein